MPPGSAPGGSGGGKSKTIVIIAAAVVVVVALAAAGWFLVGKNGSGGDDGGGAKGHGPLARMNAKPSSTQAKQLFKAPAPHAPTTDPLDLPSGWATDKVFAKATKNGILGVNAASGKRAWKVPLDGKVCGASKQISSTGKVAVVFAETVSSDAHCTQMAVVDVAKGKKVWQHKIPGSDDNLGSGIDVAISQNVAVAKVTGAEAAFSVSSGKQLWKQKYDTFGGCEDDGLAGGKHMLAIRKCGEISNPKMSVQRINPRTGRKIWEFKAPKGVQEVHVISAEPLVIAVATDPGKITDVMTVGPDHKLKGTISLGDREYDPGCSSGTESCTSAAADKNHVYLATGQHSGSAGQFGSTNELVALDFNSGQPTWKVDGGKDRQIRPIRMAGGKLLAYRTPTTSKGGEVVALDPSRQGKEQVYLRNPDATAEEEGYLTDAISEMPILYDNGRVFVQLKTASGSDKFSKYMAIGFGPK